MQRRGHIHEVQVGICITPLAQHAVAALLLPAEVDSTVVALFPVLESVLDAWAGTWTVRQDAHYRAVQGAVRELGIEIAQPLHGIRHTLVTDLRAAGVPTEDVARWVGHSLLGATWGVITGTYDHAHLQTLKRVANMIEVPW